VLTGTQSGGVEIGGAGVSMVFGLLVVASFSFFGIRLISGAEREMSGGGTTKGSGMATASTFLFLRPMISLND